MHYKFKAKSNQCVLFAVLWIENTGNQQIIHNIVSAVECLSDVETCFVATFSMSHPYGETQCKRANTRENTACVMWLVFPIHAFAININVLCFCVSVRLEPATRYDILTCAIQVACYFLFEIWISQIFLKCKKKTN